MTVTKTKPKKKESATITTDTFEWFTCEDGVYRIIETRFGLFTSVDKQGQELVTGLTEEAVHSCTPLHLLAHAPGYDGRYDHVLGKPTKHVDL